MLDAANSGLVSGGPMGPDTMVTIKAIKGFFDHSGRVRQAGDYVDVPARFAAGLVACRKAVLESRPAVSPPAEAPPDAQDPAAAKEPESAKRRGPRGLDRA